jgi:MtaA/CmuA family methyltransferase
MIMGSMSSRERVIATINREGADQVPLLPPMQGFWALGVAGVSVEAALRDPKLAAEVQMRVIERCGFDGGETMWDWLAPPVEALGCEIRQPDLGGGSTWTHVLEDPSALDKLELPDIKKDRRLQAAMETTRILVDKIGKEKFLPMSILAPFTLVGELRGVEQFMLDTIFEPGFVDESLKFASEVLQTYCEEMMTSGTDGVIMCDPTASGSLISSKDFVRFSRPHVMECQKVVRDAGGYFIMHICGDTSDRLEEVIEMKPHVYSIDYQVDLAVASKAVGERQVLLGNVKPAHTLFSGTPEASLNESLECIDKTRGRNFILGAGCDIGPGSPIENVEMMQKAVQMRKKK